MKYEIKKYFEFQNLPDDEHKRIARITSIILVALLSGFLFLILQRIIAGNFINVPPLILVTILLFVLIMTNYRGKAVWSGFTVLWVLYSLIIYMMIKNDGLHDTIILSLPGILVMGGLILKDLLFYFYSIVTFLTVIGIGLLEINGILKNKYSASTSFTDILDILIILILTTFTIRILSKSLQSSLQKGKKTEEALSESEELYRKLISTVPDIIIRTDLEGTILFVNETVFPSLNYYPTERIVGKNIISFITEEDKPKALNNLKNMFNKRPGLIEYKIVLDENILMDCEVNGDVLVDSNDNPFGIVFIIRDITERKKAERKLIESEKRLKQLTDATFEGIVITENGIIIDVNQQLADMLIRKTEDLIGTPSANYLSDESIELRDKYLNIKDEGPHEYSAIKSNGEVFPIEVRTRIISLNGKDIIVNAVHDITERKKNENELKNAKEKAEEMNKLKTHFLAQMSHEIRTPVNTILNFVSLIKSDLNGVMTEDFAEGFKVIESGGRRLIRTIDMILTMSQFQVGSFEISPGKIDLYNEILKLLYTEFRSTAALKSLEFLLVRETVNAAIIGDHFSIMQLFQNLIDNAIKYTHQGSVQIRLYKNNEGYTCVDISDTGIGISEEYLKKIFDPFSQEETGYTRRFEGNGLGLALVKKYAEVNNIKIGVSSKKNEGTVFTLLFSDFPLEC